MKREQQNVNQPLKKNDHLGKKEACGSAIALRVNSISLLSNEPYMLEYL